MADVSNTHRNPPGSWQLWWAVPGAHQACIEVQPGREVMLSGNPQAMENGSQ